MSIQPGETQSVPVEHKLSRGERVIFEPKATPGLGVYAAVANADTQQVIVRNRGEKPNVVRRRQELGRFKSLNPLARVGELEKAWQSAASELAIVTEDHDEKH
ncbi:hypothetical protein E4U57_006831, partial [Claviceps arundinis]